MANWHFKVHGGDYKAGNGTYSEGWFSRTLWLPGRWFGWKKRKAKDVSAVTIVTQDMVKDGPSKAHGAVVGMLLFGPIGSALLAGMGGRTKKEVTFIVRFVDGLSFLGSCDADTFAKLKVLELRGAGARRGR